VKFQKLWHCSVCGVVLPDGNALDCGYCTAWYFASVARSKNQPSAAERIRYAESNGVIATLRKELEGVCL
jgi:hypothetical protein